MSEKVFAPRLARRTFLAASAASAALMLTGCLNLAPRYEKPAAPTETSQDWAVSPRDAGVKEGELVTWDKFFLDERLRKAEQAKDGEADYTYHDGQSDAFGWAAAYCRLMLEASLNGKESD